MFLNLGSIDWVQIFVPGHSLLEMVVRGTLVYLALFIMLRVVLKRQSGMVSVTDLLVLVLIADAAQNAMADEYHSVPEGLVLVATILSWDYALDWLGYRYPWFHRLIRPAPLPLVENGRLIHRHLRQELLTVGELMSLLREHGVTDLAEVKRACLEGDGKLSVQKREQPGQAESKSEPDNESNDKRPI